jgi:hypothetical protein
MCYQRLHLYSFIPHYEYSSCRRCLVFILRREYANKIGLDSESLLIYRPSRLINGNDGGYLTYIKRLGVLLSLGGIMVHHK